MTARRKTALIFLIVAMFMAGCTVCLPTPRGSKCITCNGGVCQAAVVTIYCRFPPPPGGSR